MSLLPSTPFNQEIFVNFNFFSGLIFLGTTWPGEAALWQKVCVTCAADAEVNTSVHLSVK